MRANGFTLIELMIVIALMAILLSIAVPEYQTYVVNTKLTEPANELSTLRVQLEQFYQDNRNYGNDDVCGKQADGTVRVVIPPAGAKYFTYSCTLDADEQGYTLTANNKAGSGLGSADSYIYTVDDTNARKTEKNNGVALAANCWLLNKGKTSC